MMNTLQRIVAYPKNILSAALAFLKPLPKFDPDATYFTYPLESQMPHDERARENYDAEAKFLYGHVLMTKGATNGIETDVYDLTADRKLRLRIYLRSPHEEYYKKMYSQQSAVLGPYPTCFDETALLIPEADARELVELAAQLEKKRRVYRLRTALDPRSRTLSKRQALKLAKRHKDVALQSAFTYFNVVSHKEYRADLVYQQGPGECIAVYGKFPQFIDGLSLQNLFDNPNFKRDVHRGHVEFVRAPHARYEHSLDERVIYKVSLRHD